MRDPTEHAGDASAIIARVWVEIAEPALAQCPNLAQAYADIDTTLPRNISENRGLFAHAIYCTLHALAHFDAMTEALGWIIVEQQCRADDDTNAAVLEDVLYMHARTRVFGCVARLERYHPQMTAEYVRGC